MGWGKPNPIPYQSKIKEKFIGRFSIGEALWISCGAFLSYRFAQLVGPIGTDPVFSRLHYLIPLVMTSFMAFAKHRSTNLPYSQYIYLIIKIRFRKRKFLYRKVNTIEGGDRT